MKTINDIRDFLDDFLDDFLTWVSAREDVHAVGLVGSYARGEARDDSDIDLVLLSDRSRAYLEDLKWIERFGAVEKYQTEGYGKLISIRVWYQSGVEVEYGITVPASPNQTLQLIQSSFAKRYLMNVRLGFT